MEKNVLKMKVHRLAREQIRVERDKELTNCLFNHQVNDYDIEHFKYWNSLEQVCYSEALNNKHILFLALSRCKDIEFYNMIDTQELQDEIQKIIDELK